MVEEMMLPKMLTTKMMWGVINTLVRVRVQRNIKQYQQQCSVVLIPTPTTAEENVVAKCNDGASLSSTRDMEYGH